MHSTCALAKYESERRVFVWKPSALIESGEVELTFAYVLWFELARFELDCDQAAQPSVKQQQVDTKRLVTDSDRMLFAHERELAAKFQEQIAHVGEHGLSQLAFCVLFGQAEEVEYIVILEG